MKLSARFYTDMKPEKGMVRNVMVHPLDIDSSDRVESGKWYTRRIKAGNVHIMVRVQIERDVTEARKDTK